MSAAGWKAKNRGHLNLTLWKRQMADDERSAATIETLLSPFFILRHDAVKDEQGQSVKVRPGSVIYYGREGKPRSRGSLPRVDFRDVPAI